MLRNLRSSLRAQLKLGCMCFQKKLYVEKHFVDTSYILLYVRYYSSPFNLESGISTRRSALFAMFGPGPNMKTE